MTNEDTPSRVRVGPIDALTSAPYVVDLGPLRRGTMQRQAIVVRDPNDENRPRAYLNECRHLPIPLGGRSGRVLDEGGTALICRTHGALYRLTDGFCTEGPCAGEKLSPLVLEEDSDGILWVIDGRTEEE